MPDNKRDDVPVTRSLLTDAALLATPVAIAAEPLVRNWADKHIGQGGGQSHEPAPQQHQPREDSNQTSGRSSAAATWKNPWGPPTLAPAILAAT